MIREFKHNEIDFLREMLYLALYVPEGESQFPKSILDNPDISKYIDHWGTYSNDLAIVAVLNEKLIGAVWGRTFNSLKPGYGFIDEKTPEISMAVKDEFRNQRIGTKLIDEITMIYSSRGIKSVSLSVDKRNRAKSLYEKKGFIVVADKGTAVTMEKILKLIG